MNISGQCFCGFVQYQADVDEDLVAICHCTSCQRLSASAFSVVVATTDESFQLVSGTMNSFEHTSDSGTVRSRTFCPKCGSRIYSKAVGEIKEGGIEFLSLRVGAIDQRELLVPKLQVWCRSAQPWAVISSLPQFDKQPTSEEIRSTIEARSSD
jgi:hypothetical protein